MGAKIVAVSDFRGGITVNGGGGLDPLEVAEFKRTTGSVVGYPETRKISNGEILALDCDLLVPAALENQIRGDNAMNVHAKLALAIARVRKGAAERGIWP